MVTIAHATALTTDDMIGFEHALALARHAPTTLCSVHANGGAGALSAMPEATEVVAQWGKPAAALTYKKICHNCCDDPVDTVLDALRAVTPDLVVAVTHPLTGWARFFGTSRAEAIAHNCAAPTLLIPANAKGFVDSRGKVGLERILIPVGDAASANAAVRAARWMAEIAGASNVELVFLHVGNDREFPALDLPADQKFERRNVANQKLEDAVVAEAQRCEACLIVMATRGHDSAGDVLLGSHTDRVLHKAPCPVLSVPVS